MTRMETAARQPEAAVRRMIGAGIRHNETVIAQVTLAVIPVDDNQQEAWFKPCAIRVLERKGGEEGEQQPVDDGYLATIIGGLPRVPEPGFLRLNAEMCANGELTVIPIGGSAHFVRPHQKVRSSGRWYMQQEALDDNASAYGCTPDALFEKHGEEVSVIG